MVKIGKYTIIVPDSYEDALVRAYYNGNLNLVEGAEDKTRVSEIVAHSLPIQQFLITVLSDYGSNGHK